MDGSLTASCATYHTPIGVSSPRSGCGTERPTAWSCPLPQLDCPAHVQVELDEILASALDEAIRTVGAERGCLFMVDPATGQPQLRSRRGPGELFPASRTAIEQVWRSGEALLVARANEYPKPNGTANSPGGSFLCVPLTIQEQQPGVLYLETSRDARQFGQDDLALAVASAERTVAALDEACSEAPRCQMAVEQERQRLARELHDAVIPSLYSIGMAAQTSLRRLNCSQTDAAVREGLDQIRAVAQTALVEMRDTLYDLHPTALSEKGLAATLAVHCETLQSQHSLAIDFTARQVPLLSACQREAMYYVAREALWNIVRHADARRVEVSLTRQNGHLVLHVADDGRGFDASIFARRESIGLRNMEERLAMVNGRLELQSALGIGTEVTARLPLSDSPQEYHPQ
jgi:signal transduction histidine kinase